MKSEPLRVSGELIELAEFYERGRTSKGDEVAATLRRAAFLLTHRARHDWPAISPNAQGPRAWSKVGDSYLGFDPDGHIWQGWKV